MASRPAAVLLLLCFRAASAQDAHVLYDDVQVPLWRHYRGLGGTAVDHTRLWPQGRIRYFIDRENSRQGSESPDGPHDAADARMIRSAVAHWEEKTCLRFTECASEAACSKPYIRFQSAKGTCSSPVGMTAWRGHAGVNTIYMEKNCGWGAAVHEIGHSVGLVHEQSRNDRDEYVKIDMKEVKARREYNFDPYGRSGRDIGPYDYGSIMHYDARAFAKGSKPTILSRFPVGQRRGLSVGDVATVDFLYNSCKASFDAPRCVASKDVSQTILIPYGKAFKIEFNGIYDSYMRLTYAGTTAPDRQTTFSRSSGSRLLKTARTNLAFTPDKTDADKTFTLAAEFTGSDEAAACSVTVRVAPARAVCFGIAGSDPNVCSGRGRCTNDVVEPCACDRGFGGDQCAGYADCPANVVQGFDNEGELASWYSLAAQDSIDTRFKKSGRGAWRHGAKGATSSYAHMNLLDLVKPEVVTYDLAWFDGERPNIDFRGEAGDACFYMPIYSGRFYAGRKWGRKVASGRYYRIQHRIDWARQTVDHYVDGRREFAGVAFNNACRTGFERLIFWGNGWLDSLDIHCTDLTPVTAAPIAPRPTKAPTPRPTIAPTPPPTPAPVTPRPTPEPTPAPRPDGCVDLKGYCPEYPHLCKHDAVKRECPFTCEVCTAGSETPAPAVNTPVPVTPAPPVETPAPQPTVKPTAAPAPGAVWWPDWTAKTCSNARKPAWEKSTAPSLEACCRKSFGWMRKKCVAAAATPELTPAPPAAATPVPLTAAPETLSPATAAPETLAPATAAPETLAPATAVPETLAPATAAPETLAPATAAPETPAPATPAPGTRVPETPVPQTSAPGLPVPTPPTEAPATDGDVFWPAWASSACRGGAKAPKGKKSHATKAACCKEHFNWRFKGCMAWER